METLLYFLKSSVILAMFYGVYYLFLRKDTLFTAKRFFFITGLITAIVFPFLTFTNITYLEMPAVTNTTLEPLTISDLELMAATPIATPQYNIDWWQLSLVLYGTICLVLVIRFLNQLVSLYTVFKNSPSVRRGNYKYIEVKDAVAPFSFFNYIVYNPSMHTQEELQMIVTHEQIHSKQLHTIDIFLSQLIIIIQWANPFAWWYKKAIEANLEFVADAQTIPNIASKKQYQLTLVKASSSLAAPALTSPFYQSLIKKRILMLNKTTTHKRNVLKMALVLPLLAFFLFSFNIKEEIAYKEVIKETSTDSYMISSETLSSEIIAIENEINTSTSAFAVKLEDAKRNKAGNITEFTVSTKFPHQNRFVHNVTYGGDNSQISTLKLAITEDQLEFSDLEEKMVMRATAEGVKALTFQKKERSTTQDETMGEDPLYIINGEGILKSNLPENAVYEVSESIEMVKPKNAIARYGSNAKDGAMVFNGTATAGNSNTTTPTTSYHFNTNLNSNLIAGIPIFKYRITKNTTDAELEEIKKELLSKYNTTFTYTVKRNANNEIISLKLTHKDNNGNSGNYNISDTTPIKDVTFFKTDQGFGFGQAKDHDRLSELMERKEELIEKRHHMAIERREMLEEKREEMREGMREQKEALREKRKEMRPVYGIGKKRTDSMRSRRQSVFIEKEGGEPTIIVDGVVYSGDLKDLDSDNIATVNVIKDTDGINAYGISNDNGIIVIDTKTLSDQVNGWVDDFVFDFTNGDDNNTENIYITKDTTMQDLENIKNEMKAKGKSFNYKRVKRNSQGEITNIKIVFDDNSGNKQSLSKQGNGNSPIKDILIAY